MSYQGNADKKEALKAKVAALVMSGATQREAAAMLKTSPATVNRIVATLRKEWRQEASRDIADHLSIDLQRIETAIGGIWVRVTDGHLLAVDRLVSLLRLKATILGYGENVILAVMPNDGKSLAEQAKQDQDAADWLGRLAAAAAGALGFDAGREDGGVVDGTARTLPEAGEE